MHKPITQENINALQGPNLSLNLTPYSLTYLYRNDGGFLKDFLIAGSTKIAGCTTLAQLYGYYKVKHSVVIFDVSPEVDAACCEAYRNRNLNSKN